MPIFSPYNERGEFQDFDLMEAGGSVSVVLNSESFYQAGLQTDFCLWFTKLYNNVFSSHSAMKKSSGFSSCVKPFAQQKWFLVASKTKCSKHSRKHINRLVPFLRLWSLISLFFSFSFFFSHLCSLHLGKDQAEYSVWNSWLSFSILLGFSLVIFSEKKLFQ